jgi:hypothetical protein
MGKFVLGLLVLITVAAGYLLHDMTHPTMYAITVLPLDPEDRTPYLNASCGKPEVTHEGSIITVHFLEADEGKRDVTVQGRSVEFHKFIDRGKVAHCGGNK